MMAALPLVIPASSSSTSDRSCSAIHVRQPCVTKAEQGLARLAKRFQELYEYRRANSDLLETLASTTPKTTQTLGPSSVTDASDGAAADSGLDEIGAVRLSGTAVVSGDSLAVASVLGDVTRLLKKLDMMQSVLSKALEFEKGQVQDLRRELKRMEKHRLEQLPAIVQSEHDKYFVNLTELEWQATYSGRQEIRLDNKLTTAKGQLSRVTEELTFFTDYKEVMVQKTAEDNEAIQQLRKEDRHASLRLAQHRMELGSNENKLIVEMETAQVARQAVQLELQSAREALRRINEDVTRMNLQHSSNLHAIIQWREALANNKAQVEILSKDIVEQKERQSDLNEKIASLLVSIRDAHDEQGLEDLRNAKLEDQRLKARDEESDIEETKSAGLADVIRQQHAMTAKLKNMKDEIKRMQEEAAKAEKVVEKAVKGFDRSKVELTRIQEQMEVASEECSRVKAEKKDFELRVNAMQRQLREDEERLRSDLENAKKDELEEERQHVTIQSRIIADKHKIEQVQEEAAQKHIQKADLMGTAEVEEKELEVQAEVLAKEWKSCENNRETLVTEVEQKQREIQDLQNSLGDQIAPLEPAKEQLSVEAAGGDGLIKDLQWERDMLEKKIKDMNISSDALGKLITQTGEDIEEKSSALDKKQESVKQGRVLEERLAAELKEVKDFRWHAGDTHSSYMKMEHDDLTTHKDNLAKEVERNRKLAEHYKRSQENSMHAKAELAELLEQRGQLDESLRDHKQLVDWQRRMHGTMETTYKKRHRDSHRHLEKFVKSAKKTTDSLLDIEEDMSAATQSVKAFLRRNTLPPPM